MISKNVSKIFIWIYQVFYLWFNITVGPNQNNNLLQSHNNNYNQINPHLNKNIKKIIFNNFMNKTKKLFYNNINGSNDFNENYLLNCEKHKRCFNFPCHPNINIFIKFYLMYIFILTQ